MERNRIICLSNIYDQHYHDVRGEKISRHLTTPFRRDLFQCLERASGREVVLLSSPPKAAERRGGRWLPAVETKFATHRQFFCPNWDVPKLRIPLSWFFYAKHALRHVRSGDVVLIDNYEWIYILAARLLRRRRRVTFVLNYLDGKHLIDRSVDRALSGLAESWGRPLFSAALLSNPILGDRLPEAMPRELVPGFIPKEPPPARQPGDEIRFLYTGALDHSHGTELLTDVVQYLPQSGWRLTIAGSGPLTESVNRLAQDPRWKGRMHYQPPLPPDQFKQLLAEHHVGLNCQRSSDPTCRVTFPSKVFTYFAAGLPVISGKAGAVEPVCGKACLYYEDETPQSLADAMKRMILDFPGVVSKLDVAAVAARYSTEAMAERLRKLLQSIGVKD